MSNLKDDNDPNGRGDVSDSSFKAPPSMRTQVKNFSREQLKIVLDKKIREEKDMNVSKS